MVVAYWKLRSGKCGCPKKECYPEFLAYAMDLGGMTNTALLFGWLACTISSLPGVQLSMVLVHQELLCVTMVMVMVTVTPGPFFVFFPFSL